MLCLYEDFPNISAIKSLCDRKAVRKHDRQSRADRDMIRYTNIQYFAEATLSVITANNRSSVDFLSSRLFHSEDDERRVFKNGKMMKGS